MIKHLNMALRRPLGGRARGIILLRLQGPDNCTHTNYSMIVIIILYIVYIHKFIFINHYSVYNHSIVS